MRWHFAPRTGSPICGGANRFRHPPVHCKRSGYGVIYGNVRPRWTCPVCGSHHYR